MRILYVYQHFATLDSAGGTREYEMARRMVRAGHGVIAVTSDPAIRSRSWWRRTAGEQNIDGIRVKKVSVPYAQEFSNSRRLRAFLSFAIRAIGAGIGVRKVDVVFASSTPLTVAIPGIFLKAWHRCPMVFEVRDLWPELPIAVGALRNPILIYLARWLEIAAYRHSARVVALSPGMRDGVVEAGYPSDRVAVIPNAADLELFRVGKQRAAAFLKKHRHLEGGPLIVYVGTMGLINGLGYMVEIAAAVLKRNSPAKFLIVGGGAESDRVASRARELGVLNRNLWIMPPIPKREVPPVLAAATLATSFFINVEEMWHNSANKFFDALAAGKPIMINYNGWQAELLAKSGAGIVVPSNAAEVAADLLLDLANDSDRLEASARAARELAASMFSRDKLATELLTVLEAVAKEHGNTA